MEIGARIRQAREEAGLTQNELGELIGVGMRQIQYYEAGESNPYLKLDRIAEATGKTMGWLLHGDPTPPAEELRARLERIELLLSEVLRRLDEEDDDPAAAEAGS